MSGKVTISEGNSTVFRTNLPISRGNSIIIPGKITISLVK